MNACWAWIRLEKPNGVARWTIVIWNMREKIYWEDFTVVMQKVKTSLWCGDHYVCRNKKDCSITRIYKDKVSWTLALI